MLRKCVAAVLALSVLTGFSSGNPEVPNTYNMPATNSPSPTGSNNWDTTGKHRLFPNIALASTKVWVTIGQSKIANNSASGSTPYVVTNATKCFNIDPYKGPGPFYWDLNDPVVGASASAGFFQAGWHGRLCDKLLTAAYGSQHFFLPLAIAGSLVADWDTGGAYNARLTAAAALLTANGITVTGVLWQQGTADCIGGTTQAAYAASLRSVISYWRGLPGRSSDKWMIAKDTINGANAVCSTIQNAQVAVGGDASNFVGPDADTLGSPTNTDGTHYNNTGNDAIAGLWSTKIQAAFLLRSRIALPPERRRRRPTRPTSRARMARRTRRENRRPVRTQEAQPNGAAENRRASPVSTRE